MVQRCISPLTNYTRYSIAHKRVCKQAWQKCNQNVLFGEEFSFLNFQKIVMTMAQ